METLFVGCSEVFEAEHVRPMPGRTLIVGSQVYGGKSDRRKLYDDVLGVDMLDGPGVDRVLNLEHSLPDDLGIFSHIECMSVMEHSRKPWAMAENLQSLLLPGGTIYITVPFIWRLHSYPDDYWRITPNGLQSIFPQIVWEKMAFGQGHKVAEVSRKVAALKRNGITYLARTETLAFGRYL